MKKFWVIIDDLESLGCEIIVKDPRAWREILTGLKGKIECLLIDGSFGPFAPIDGPTILRNVIEEDLLPDCVQTVSGLPEYNKIMGNILKQNGYHFDEENKFWKKIFD